MLNNLAAQSLGVVPEAARMIIEEEQKRSTNCLPWMDLFGFQERVAGRILELEHSFDDSLLFCDRGMVDGHAYATSGKVPTPDSVQNLGIKRYDAVFVLDQIPQYRADESRKESPEKAQSIHRAIFEAYREFGYNPIRVPVMPPKERVKYFVKLVGMGAK